MTANADRTPRAKAIGWTRSGDGFGRVTKYHVKSVCNCITSFWGGTKTHGRDSATPHPMSSLSSDRAKNNFKACRNNFKDDLNHIKDEKNRL